MWLHFKTIFTRSEPNDPVSFQAAKLGIHFSISFTTQSEMHLLEGHDLGHST